MPIAKKILVVASITVGTFLAALDATIIGTTVPSMISSLGGLPLYTWTLSAYLLASTVVIPVCGKLADLYGRKPVYLVGMTLFLLGSVLCSLAQTIEQLTLFRAIQGFGAGAIVPMAITIIADTFSKAQQARLQGLLGAMWGVAGILGPTMGEAVIRQWGWPWAFLINLPLGIVSAGLLIPALRENTSRPAHVEIDYAGALTFAAGVIIFLSTLLDAGVKGQGFTLESAGMLAIAAVALGLFVLIECTVKEPMLPLYLFFRNRTVRAYSLAGIVVSTGMLGAISYIPMYFLAVLGSNDGISGNSLIPMGVGWLAGSAFAGLVTLRLGYRHTVLAGTVMVVLGAFMLTMLDESTASTFAGAAAAALSLGLGASCTAVLIAIQNSVARKHQGIASSSVQFLRTLGGIVGISLLGLLLSSQISLDPAYTLAATPVDGTFSSGANALLEPGLASALRVGIYLSTGDLLASALHTVFWGILAFAILALVVSVFLPGKDLAPELAEQPQVEEG